MHYIATAFISLTYPIFVYLIRLDQRWRNWAYFFLGMLPFTNAAWNLDGALVNWAAWPGYAKGVVITAEDTLALAIISTTRQPRGAPPLIGFFAAYMVAVAFSIIMAGVGMAAFFYLFQLLRIALVVIAVAKIAANPGALLWVGNGLAGAMIYEAIITIDQKLHGVFQAPGTLAHPNQLGMMVHVALLPILAMLLSGYRSKILMLGSASALVVVVLGASRATIGFVGVGVALLLLLSMRRKSTPQKKRMFGLAILTMLVATPFLLHSVNARLAQQYEHASEGDYDERAAFERAAKAMWADHPFGVGANNYVVVANGQGYSQRAGVAWNGGSRGTNVHNTYLLMGAETGWAGLLTYCALMGATILAGWRFSYGNRSDPRGDIALGSTIALAIVMLHSRYEWITVTYHVQYVIAISLGIVSGLVRVRAVECKQAARRESSAPAPVEPAAGEAVA